MWTFYQTFNQNESKKRISLYIFWCQLRNINLFLFSLAGENKLFFSGVAHNQLFALPQVTDNFSRPDFNKMCWTLCFRKNLGQDQLHISNDDAFKIWCIFNFLSEDRYPLIMVTEEVRKSGMRLCSNTPVVASYTQLLCLALIGVTLTECNIKSLCAPFEAEANIS